MGESEQFKFDILTQMDKTRMSDIFKPLDALSDRFGSPAPPVGVAALPPAPSEAAAAPALSAGSVVAVADAPVVAILGKRAVPTTPLKKGQALMKGTHKLMCEIQSTLNRMKAMKYQNELMVRLQEIVTALQEVYNGVQSLVKEGIELESEYKPFLDKFLDIKSGSQSDRLEGDGVVAHMGRPQIKRKVPGAKKHAKKLKPGAAVPPKKET